MAPHPSSCEIDLDKVFKSVVYIEVHEHFSLNTLFKDAHRWPDTNGA